MQSIVSKFSKVKGTILISGASGTGKTYLAKMIHQNSEQKNEPLVCLNLAAVQETLIESELFGHEKGAFTGAYEKRIGYCQMVGKGTLFLDEIGELGLSSQKKLLNLLEEKEYSAIGSNKTNKFSGRIIAATNKNLSEEIKNGNFREDLYYRLMVFNIHLSPVSSDQQLVKKMIDYYFNIYKDEYAKHDLFIDDQCMDKLINFNWPGNIREIKNCMEFLVCMSVDCIREGDLPDWISPLKIKKDFFKEYPLAYRDALDTFEREYFNFILKRFDGRVNFTAQEVGLSKTTLISKIRKFGIDIWSMKKEKIEHANVKDRLILVG
ncbi:MAG: hypothetical protein A2381_10915 [Bdellovibrionales bacterium RIFOXYB1_FULL_37_110]|nr:MAG: hypothetical protein A2181_07055 [Bdellovibrionales bacterium RIFOXYA1_FULL_38_20]OFZ51175.1 MAG: hypothetical protein A2417_17900 [Bdellovibrionales bacterium RIFOXYC1_FULL_37_79]OFZ61281.1 MAG: hypothetical protein A2381_10915 [Bdellovibrionales bacterium RIFOXYB1_FULL_37_110]OFZ62144.1 MAG: hypothetical protein A2577_14490 [Bdellovibrionales bacterium RIFOXYD1_FULL_36_51]